MKVKPVILMMSSHENPFLRMYIIIVVLEISETYYNSIIIKKH